MKNSVIFFIGIAVIVLSSCGSYAKQTAPIPVYTAFKFDAEINENEQLANIDINNASFPISLVWFKEYERTFIKVNDRFLQIDMNWTLDDGLNPEMERISFFKNKEDYFILFPTYTEEFPTLGLIAISENGTFEDLGFHTYNYSDFDKAKDEMLNGTYLLNEVNDTIRVMLNSSMKVMLSDRYYSEISGDPITEKEKTMLQALLSNEATDVSGNNEDVLVVKTYSFDLDNDGILDKVNVIQEDEVLDDYDRQYFGLAIEILRGEGDGFKEWGESNCIFDVQNNCVCEGFERIHFTDGSLTVEQQACYDYTFVVNSSTTFTVIDNEIYLKEYHEEYFNKGNHEQEIPTKTWTEIDFGRVKCENVSEDFLLDLRLK